MHGQQSQPHTKSLADCRASRVPPGALAVLRENLQQQGGFYDIASSTVRPLFCSLGVDKFEVGAAERWTREPHASTNAESVTSTINEQQGDKRIFFVSESPIGE